MFTDFFFLLQKLCYTLKGCGNSNAPTAHVAHVKKTQTDRYAIVGNYNDRREEPNKKEACGLVMLSLLPFQRKLHLCQEITAFTAVN